jgi:hypothetical protein
MTFLQLCQRVRSECDIPGAGPVTVIGQTGELERVVNWVNAAWMDIQTAHQDWNWLRTSLTPFATVALQTTYLPTSAPMSLTNFGSWDRDSFRVYDTAAGIGSETPLTYFPYDKWRNTYLIGALRSTPSRPDIVTVAPDNSLGFGPITAAGYSIVGDYFKLPTEMSADVDIPILPVQYHIAIVYRAMMFAGAFYAAQEVYQRGELEFNKQMRRMTNDRMPDILMGGALA